MTTGPAIRFLTMTTLKGNVLENIEARSPRIEIILNFSPQDRAIQAFLN